MHDVYNALVAGCNLLIVRDGQRNHAMVCSWATQVSPRRIVLNIGAQSETGKLLEVGTQFSVNVLFADQLALARTAGTKHSSAVDKLADQELVEHDGVALLARAKKRLCCRTITRMDLSGTGYSTCWVAEILDCLPEQPGEPLLLDAFFGA